MAPYRDLRCLVISAAQVAGFWMASRFRKCHELKNSSFMDLKNTFTVGFCLHISGIWSAGALLLLWGKKLLGIDPWESQRTFNCRSSLHMNWWLTLTVTWRWNYFCLKINFPDSLEITPRFIKSVLLSMMMKKVTVFVLAKRHNRISY